jgi:hypothetical protein
LYSGIGSSRIPRRERRQATKHEEKAAWSAFWEPLVHAYGAQARVASSWKRIHAYHDEKTYEITLSGYRRGAKPLGRLAVPGPVISWQLAWALRMTGHQWCAGALVLFAASHYREYLSLMSEVGKWGVGATRILELNDAITAALAHLDVDDRQELARLYELGEAEYEFEVTKGTGWDYELAAPKARQAKLARSRYRERAAARRIWKLSRTERQIFDRCALEIAANPRAPGLSTTHHELLYPIWRYVGDASISLFYRNRSTIAAIKRIRRFAPQIDTVTVTSRRQTPSIRGPCHPYGTGHSKIQGCRGPTKCPFSDDTLPSVPWRRWSSMDP